MKFDPNYKARKEIGINPQLKLLSLVIKTKVHPKLLRSAIPNVIVADSNVDIATQAAKNNVYCILCDWYPKCMTFM